MVSEPKLLLVKLWEPLFSSQYTLLVPPPATAISISPSPSISPACTPLASTFDKIVAAVKDGSAAPLLLNHLTLLSTCDAATTSISPSWSKSIGNMCQGPSTEDAKEFTVKEGFAAPLFSSQ